MTLFRGFIAGLTVFVLMEQGVDVVGGTMQNGLVYPTIRGTVYINGIMMEHEDTSAV